MLRRAAPVARRQSHLPAAVTPPSPFCRARPVLLRCLGREALARRAECSSEVDAQPRPTPPGQDPLPNCPANRQDRTPRGRHWYDTHTVPLGRLEDRAVSPEVVSFSRHVANSGRSRRASSASSAASGRSESGHSTCGRREAWRGTPVGTPLGTPGSAAHRRGLCRPPAATDTTCCCPGCAPRVTRTPQHIRACVAGGVVALALLASIQRAS